MTYIIDATVNNQGRDCAIDSSFFFEIKQANAVVLSHHKIEERFDIFLQNYVELESKIFQLLVEHTLQSGKIFDPKDQTPADIERCLSNFLSSARGYKSQILRDRSNHSSVKHLIRQLAEGSVEFCIVEEWRNYAQHQDLLIRGWSLPSNWTTEDAQGRRKRRHALAPYISLSTMQGYEQTNKSLLEKLKSVAAEDGNISVIPVLRKYIEDVSYLHKSIRDMQADDLRSARSVLSRAREMGVGLGAKPDANMFAYHLDEDESILDRVYLGERLSESLQHLQSKNRAPLVRFGSVEFYV